MVIKVTNHFKEKCEERYTTRTCSTMVLAFKYACKLIKKKKLHPIDWKQPDTYEIKHWWLTFIYKKEAWYYLLLTTY
jgi:hypothetical protein